MIPLRRRINPQTFVITLRQITEHLRICPQRILNWEKWNHVLWVHIEGLGGYFVSYRKFEQWIATCRTLIRFCPNLQALNALWESIIQEAKPSDIQKKRFPALMPSSSNDCRSYILQNTTQKIARSNNPILWLIVSLEFMICPKQ